MQYTSLTSRVLRHGLGVLFQQNLLYARTDPDTNITKYEANPYACYNLIRTGKIIEIVERKFGPSERDLVQTLLMLGHARINDLTQAFTSRTSRYANGAHKTSTGEIESATQFQAVLARLIRAEIIETVRADTFRNPADVHQEITQEITKVAVGERSTTKDKAEQEKKIAERYKVYQDKGRELKRWLDQSQGTVSKRRKLANGRATNGNHNEEDVPDFNVSHEDKLTVPCRIGGSNQHILA